MLDTQNKAWAENKSTFGYKMLMKMGWAEGGGLGKNGDGATAHIKVTKREEALGLGAQSDPTGNGVFVEALMGFNDVLQSLAAHHGDASTVKAKKSGPTLADKEKVIFKKRARAKDVTRYSAVDKAAIFCGIPGSFQVMGGEAASAPPEEETPAAEGKPAKKEKKEKKEKKAKKAKSREEE